MKIVYKPWGKEEWLELNDKYCYKRIYINAGHKTSFQYHNFKRETNYIISGEAEIWLENNEGEIIKKIMKSGDYFNVIPPKKHRVIALTDIILQEVSTPEVDDVIRIEDDTNRINGKIESEHQKPAVLILAAGYGTRLKNLTSNINKVLLPINNKAIISHIIEKFPKDYDFVISLGFKGDMVKEYLEITHPERNFIFEKIDNYSIDNSGPGLSALQCSKHLQRPFYFITGDCLINSQIPYLDGNWIGIQETCYPEKYSTAEIDNDSNVISFKNKSINGYDKAFIGLGCITEYSIFWEELKKNMNDYEIISAFYNPKVYSVLKAKTIKWFDTGNLDDLIRTREQYNDNPISLRKDIGEITYSDNSKFLKFIPNNQTLLNKKKRADLLKNFIPHNFGSTDNFIYYDWVDGKTLYELDSPQVFSKFLKQLEKNIKNGVKNNENDIKEFYVNKTKNRFQKFINKYGSHYSTTNYEINNKTYSSMESLLSNEIKIEMLLDNPFYNEFHGDLQFDNIIYNQQNDKFFYIDWRDSFGGSTESGDKYYDLSKLYGGLIIPYNLMKNEDNINLTEGTYSIKYSYLVSENINKFKNEYENWLINNGFDLEKIKYITGLIFLNMSPLHDEKFSKMLWFKSIEMLNNYDK